MTANNLLILALLALSVCCESKKEPDSKYALRHRVTAYADILTTEQEDSLTTMMEDLELKIGSQIAILTMLNLNGQKIEEVSLKTAEATKLGRATHNDDVLITIAYEDRRMRIEGWAGGSSS